MTSKQKKAANMRRYRARWRRERSFSDECRWYKLSEIARQFQKSEMTIWNWCNNGFIFTLGYRLRRDVSGHLFVGVPLQNHFVPKAAPCSQSN